MIYEQISKYSKVSSTLINYKKHTIYYTIHSENLYYNTQKSLASYNFYNRIPETYSQINRIILIILSIFPFLFKYNLHDIQFYPNL